jgi:hypothetical protein
MDIGSIANVSVALNQVKTNDAVSVAVLKKALDIQAEGAQQLLQALPEPTSGNLGNKINTLA